jgi:hypothetical protein
MVVVATEAASRRPLARAHRREWPRPRHGLGRDAGTANGQAGAKGSKQIVQESAAENGQRVRLTTLELLVLALRNRAAGAKPRLLPSRPLTRCARPGKRPFNVHRGSNGINREIAPFWATCAAQGLRMSSPFNALNREFPRFGNREFGRGELGPGHAHQATHFYLQGVTAGPVHA